MKAKNPNITMILQSLRGAQPIVILSFLAIRCAMCIQDLVEETGLSDDFISPAVKSLVGKGLLAKQVGAHGKPYYMPISESFFRELSLQIPLPAESGRQIPLAADSALSSSSNYLTVLKEKELITTTTLSVQIPLAAESAEVRRILENTNLLFGEPGVLYSKLDLSAISVAVALGWVKQGHNAKNLEPCKRAGLVYNGLKSGALPKDAFMKDGVGGLPDEYLLAVGLKQPETYTCDECNLEFGEDYDAWSEHHEDIHAPEIRARSEAERERVLAEMEERVEERRAELAAIDRQRRISQVEENCEKYGAYFRDAYALFGALAVLFDTDRFQLERVLKSAVVDSHTYSLFSTSEELVTNLQEAWAEEEVIKNVDELYPGLCLNFEKR